MINHSISLFHIAESHGAFGSRLFSVYKENSTLSGWNRTQTKEIWKVCEENPWYLFLLLLMSSSPWFAGVPLSDYLLRLFSGFLAFSVFWLLCLFIHFCVCNVCVCVCTHVHMIWSTCKIQRTTCGSGLCSHSIWVPRMDMIWSRQMPLHAPTDPPCQSPTHNAFWRQAGQTDKS